MTKFENSLKETNESLWKYILEQKERIIPELNKISTVFSEFTDHSAEHSRRVLKIGESLDEGKLNDYEKAVFVLSSYYHDIGMIVNESELNQYLNTLEKKPNLDVLVENIIYREKLQSEDPNTIKQFLALEYFRTQHATRSFHKIRKMYPRDDRLSYFNNTINLWDAVAEVCQAHTMDAKDLLIAPYSNRKAIGEDILIDTIYLSLLLRLSDISHFSRDRAFPYYCKYKNFISKRSESIWDKYADVVTTIPNKKNYTIEVKGTCHNLYNHRAIISNSNAIQKELINCHKILNKSASVYRFRWNYIDTSGVVKDNEADYDYYDTKFRLKQDKIISLLMGKALYRDPLYALRECIQNSIDSIRIYSKKVKNSSDYILVDYKGGDNPTIDVFDTGTGMSKLIINDYFLSVGEKSYWYQEKCLEEWDYELNKTDLIADHGIGVLSYFMIAKIIEVFTVYHHQQEYLHVMIENAEDSIVFKKSKEDNFPKTPEKLDDPWNQHHGTCIRLHLKEAIDCNTLLKFFAKNVLRLEVDFYFKYNDDFINKIENRWIFLDLLDKHCDKKPPEAYLFHRDELSKNSDNINEIFKALYTEESDFYNGPPQDCSIDDNFFDHDDIKGKIHLNYDDIPYPSFRISQNGILIEDGIDFVFSNFSEIKLLNLFGFDINVSGKYQFQLDAERARIIDNEFNKDRFVQLSELILVELNKQICKISSTAYFVCGGIFYHGIIDIAYENPDSKIYFHKNLVSNIGNHDIQQRDIIHQILSSLKTAKLYMHGFEQNTPVSVNDIKNIKKRKFIVIFDNLQQIKDEGAIIDFELLLQKPEISAFLNELKKIDNQLIYLPTNKDSFILPILDEFDFKIFRKEPKFKVLEIIDKCNQPFSKKRSLFGSEFFKDS